METVHTERDLRSWTLRLHHHTFLLSQSTAPLTDNPYLYSILANLNNTDLQYINTPISNGSYVLWLDKYYCINGKPESAVGIATSCSLDDRGVGVWFPVGSENFFSPRHPDRLWGSTQSPIRWVLGALSPGVKRSGSEADHSSAVSAEVNKIWIYIPPLPYAFIL
jgi:hypothetical protein